MSEPVVLWFRRDLRLADHPALQAAAAYGPVVPAFVIDPALWDRAGAPRREFLARSLAELDARIGGHLVVRHGEPERVLHDLAREINARAVFATDDHGPYGRTRDAAVGSALVGCGIETQFVGSNYAVAPGTVRNGSGDPYRVFTPFYRRWLEHEVDPPIPEADVDWHRAPGDGVPAVADCGVELPPVGEGAAWDRIERFLSGSIDAYDHDRDRPGIDGTSRLSTYLKWGTVHPRQLLDRLGDDQAHDTFRKELAWREFYADVLLHRPETVGRAFNPKMRPIEVDEGPEADQRFEAWCEGRTGFPIVDAGMRQLLAEGWMHNRVRMIVASFLVKDLHLDWRRGARWFMARLVDGDLASNTHGWQWTAGCGTDAAPYFRIFNPTTQSRRYDPDGDYLRRWIPELAHLGNREIHDPHGGASPGLADYPRPMVDHQVERAEALARYERLRSSS